MTVAAQADVSRVILSGTLHDIRGQLITTHHIRHFVCRPFAVTLVAAFAGVVAAAQQPAPPQPDAAALARQAEIDKRPDTPGTGRFPAMKEEVASLPRHVVHRPQDPRVKTMVIHNSGVLNNGPTNMTGISVGKEVLQTLHTPVISDATGGRTHDTQPFQQIEDAVDALGREFLAAVRDLVPARRG